MWAVGGTGTRNLRAEIHKHFSVLSIGGDQRDVSGTFLCITQGKKNGWLIATPNLLKNWKALKFTYVGRKREADSGRRNSASYSASRNRNGITRDRENGSASGSFGDH